MTKNSDVLSSDLMSVWYPVGIDEPGRGGGQGATREGT
jgi:hypothetical protein